jgi:hypothetical protein
MVGGLFVVWGWSADYGGNSPSCEELRGRFPFYSFSCFTGLPSGRYSNTRPICFSNFLINLSEPQGNPNFLPIYFGALPVVYCFIVVYFTNFKVAINRW